MNRLDPIIDGLHKFHIKLEPSEEMRNTFYRPNYSLDELKDKLEVMLGNTWEDCRTQDIVDAAGYDHPMHMVWASMRRPWDYSTARETPELITSRLEHAFQVLRFWRRLLGIDFILGIPLTTLEQAYAEFYRDESLLRDKFWQVRREIDYLPGSNGMLLSTIKLMRIMLWSKADKEM